MIKSDIAINYFVLKGLLAKKKKDMTSGGIHSLHKMKKQVRIILSL